MKTLIIAGGTPPSQRLLQREMATDCIIIAADSGADCLWQYQITPDFLIGDLDSIHHEAFNHWINKSIPIEQHSCDKNNTDTQLALQKAITLNATEITFLGCLGGSRVDHLFGAFGLLAECAKQNITASLKDDYQTITLLNKPMTIHGKNKELFSLQAYGESVKNLSIHGSKYELQNYELKMGDALTLSNEFQDTPVNISFATGTLILFRLVIPSVARNLLKLEPLHGDPALRSG